MEFGANNIKRSANKIIIAILERSYFAVDQEQVTAPIPEESTSYFPKSYIAENSFPSNFLAKSVEEIEKIPLVVVDNEGNIVTEI